MYLMMSTPRKKERQKLIKCFLVFGPSPSSKEKRKVQTISKYVTKVVSSAKDSGSSGKPQLESLSRNQHRNQQLPEDDIDESSIALLCLPDGIQVRNNSVPPKFHSFLITKQNGSRIYGSSLIFWEPVVEQQQQQQQQHCPSQQLDLSRNDPGQEEKVFCNKALCFLTTVPFVIAMKNLLFYIWENNLSSTVVHSICNVKMPNKGKCIKLMLPQSKKKRVADGSIIIRLDSDLVDSADSFTEIYIYRGPSNFPLFDYPFRELFTNILCLDKFLTAFVATLLEFQILIMSHDYQNLMYVAEALTSVLLPFQWQHVYVPILPSKLGLNYLDAPTPYIMGINSISAKESIASVSWSNSVQCRIDCDTSKVDYYCDDNEFQQYLLQNVPPFIDELRTEVDSILSTELKLVPQTTATIVNQNEAPKGVTSEVSKKYQVSANDFSYLDDLKLNQSVRIAFMRAIKKYILQDYEKFIVNTYSPRDNVKFDTVSYLIDQPDSMRPFLTKFLETQMFASFIDETAKKAQKSKQHLFSSQQSLFTSSAYDDPDDLAVFNDLLLETRFSGAQEINVYCVKSDIPEEAEKVKLTYSPLRRPSRNRLSNELRASSPQLSQETKEESGKENNGGHRSPNVLSSPVRVPAAFAAQTNWKVVESLLREVKAKTKRILLEKMGNEEVAPLGCGSVGDMEENTLIASLCDLIERIWSHATNNENEHTKCSFWTHLVAFTALDSNSEVPPTIDSNMLTPALSQMSLDSPSVSPSTLSTPSSPSKNYLKPIPSTIYQDFKSVQLMSDVKTDIGKSRAFIRLALERKLLSKHLRTLLNNQSLLETMYKRYAFLRCEEEREQFLTHLLTLNAVDLRCFTNTFTTSTQPYTLVVYGSNTLSGWISASGTLGSTNEIYVMNPTHYFTFKQKNLGILTTLTVSVSQATKVFIEYCFIRNDVTGHTYKFPCNQWFGRSIDDGATERVLVGQMIVNGSIGDVIKKREQSRSSSIGRHWSRALDTYKDEQLDAGELQEKLGEIVNQIVRFYYTSWNKSSNLNEENHALSTARVTSPVKKNGQNSDSKYSHHNYCNSSPTKTSATLTHTNKLYPSLRGDHVVTLIRLIYGEKQLLWTLQQIFYYGFKNRGRSSFRKQIFLWDYILRIQCEHKLCNSNSSKDSALMVAAKEKFVTLIDNISSKAAHWGKDGKFGLFLVISLRDHLLTHFLKILTRTPVVQQFYDNNSFLRDKTLLAFLNQILTTFNDMTLTIEPSLTKSL